MKSKLLSVSIYILKRIMLQIRQFEWMVLIFSLVQITVPLRVTEIVIIDYINQLHAKFLVIATLVGGKNIRLL